MISSVPEVIAVTVTYNTPLLVRRAVRSVRQMHPDVPILVVDGSDRRWTRIATKLMVRGCDLHQLGFNIHHGPGIDYGIRQAKSDLVLVLDSDVELTAPVIELLKAALPDDGYGAGLLQQVDHQGVNVEHGTPYLHPSLMLVRRAAYLAGPPAIRHGAPMIQSMVALHGEGVVDVPDVRPRFVHDGMGTVGRTGGYHLGEELGRFTTMLMRARHLRQRLRQAQPR